MKRFATGFALSFVVGSLGLACDSGEKKAGGKDAKAAKSDAKADSKGAKADAKAGGDAKADAKPEAAKPVKLAKISLEDSGMDATLSAPEGAKIAEEFGAFTVKAGDAFQLEIHTGTAKMDARKKEIESNTVQKLKTFHTDSETELLYETEVMGKTEFHFVTNMEVDGAQYHCEDTKGKAYARADIDAMVAACKSLVAT